MPFNTLINRPRVLFSAVAISIAVMITFWWAAGLPGRSRATQNVNTGSVTQPATASEAVRPGLPVRFKIPSINIDAAIEHVGRTPQGAMDVPSGRTTSAWFNLGPRPGEIGSAVIDGHNGWVNGLPSIFNKLHTVHPGDIVSVEDDQGVTTRYRVRELKTYAINDRPSNIFTSDDGQAHLNLITCEGVWSKAKQSYSHRLVVFTDKTL